MHVARSSIPPIAAGLDAGLLASKSRAARGRDRAAAAILALVSRHRAVPPPLLLHRSRGDAPVAEARQLAMYLTHVVLRRTYVEVGSFFGRDRTTVAHACARIEDLRDLPEVEAELARLEAELIRRKLLGASSNDAS
jgi:chromosomal replication initiation ATPase DnaA